MQFIILLIQFIICGTQSNIVKIVLRKNTSETKNEENWGRMRELKPKMRESRRFSEMRA